MPKSVRWRTARAAALLALWLLAAPAAVRSEASPPPAVPPGEAEAETETGEPASDPAAVETPAFTIHLGLAPILDYTWLTQDRASVEQVGEQEGGFDVRSARVMARGNLFNRRQRPWSYLISFEYRGLDSDPDNDWNFTDVTLTIPAGRLGDVSFGKLKETFAYEMVGDAANLPHLERLMSPFFVSRSWGVRLNRSVADDRVTLAAGAYNDWFTTGRSYAESGWDYSARVTGLAYWSAEGRRFLHLAGSWRYVDADGGTLRYKGRPESNVTDNYVDTGEFAASHANHFGAEALWNEGPFSLLAEYDVARVASTVAGDPTFAGWYVTGAWVVTGEHRPYDRKVGYARRVLPERRLGAVELMARYGEVDLTDGDLDGGLLDKWFAGVNWWASRRWRISLGYGRAGLDKGGSEGVTGQTLLRVQWIY